jgi:hypothetical protein
MMSSDGTSLAGQRPALWMRGATCRRQRCHSSILPLRVSASSMLRAVVKPLFRVSLRPFARACPAEQAAHPMSGPRRRRSHHSHAGACTGPVQSPVLTRVRPRSWVDDPVLVFYPSAHDSRAAPRDYSVSIRTRELRYLLRGGRRGDPTRTVRAARVRRGDLRGEPTRLSGSRPRGQRRS